MAIVSRRAASAVCAGMGSTCFEPGPVPTEGELLTIKNTAPSRRRPLDPPSLAQRRNGPGRAADARGPWRIRLTHDLMARFSDDAGEDFIPMHEAMKALGVSRQTVLQRVKRGELEPSMSSKASKKKSGSKR